MKKSIFSLTAAASVALVGGASAAVVLDGALGSDTYGAALYTNTDSPTGFGDNSNADPVFANGSEIDQVFGTFDGGNLNLLVAGNLETNFNRLVVFVDSISGGQNVIDGSTTDTSSGGGLINDYNGLTFDAGFEADFMLVYNGGNDPIEAFSDFVSIGDTGSFVGGSGAGNTVINGSGAFAGLGIDLNNSNILGVTDAATVGSDLVTTGVEFVVPVSLIGDPTGEVKITAFVAGGGFLSNQITGGAAGGANLGNSPDLSAVAGDQFVTVIPEPASLALVALGGVAMLGRRRSA